jgi:hypothetical protein
MQVVRVGRVHTGKTAHRGFTGRLGVALLASGAAALLTAGSAQAANVTVGSPLTATFSNAICGSPCTIAHMTLTETGAMVSSPVEGAVIRWRLLKGSNTFKYKLRVLAPAGGTSFTGVGTSAAVTPASANLETFETALPIKTGQTVGLDLEAGAPIGIAAGGTFGFWAPQLGDGATAPPASTGAAQFSFNAEIQPRPTVTSVSPSSGPLQGGTGVVISGTDFTNVKSVSFGTVPAQSFGVGSAGQVTAIAPAAAGPGAVNVTVTTIAGSSAASPATQYTYTACVVPNVKGKSLKASRKALTAAGCALGNVKGKKRKTAKVKKQDPKAGTALAPGSKVNVTLKSRAKKSAGKK